jgi:crossover junction endodeoxyribonuclease RuvC
LIVIGIDPGLTGAIAFIDPAAGSASVHTLPTLNLPPVGRAGKSYVPRRIDGRATALLIRQHVAVGDEAHAFIEGVRALPVVDGRSTAQSEGSLMRSLGALEAVLDVLNLPPTPVLPQTWQSFYGLVGKYTELRARGELPAAVVKAVQLYPGLAAQIGKVSAHNMAEAVLIGHYAARKLVATR